MTDYYYVLRGCNESPIAEIIGVSQDIICMPESVFTVRTATPLTAQQLKDLDAYFATIGYDRIAEKPIENFTREQFVMDIKAAGLTMIHPLATYDNLEHTDVTTPGISRNISFTVQNKTSGAATLDECYLQVTGKNIFGDTQVSNITIPSQSIPKDAFVTVYGVKGFRLVTKVQIFGVQSTGNANWRFEVGTGNALGLNRRIKASGEIFALKRNTDNASLADYTISATNLTITPSVAWIAGDDFTIMYESKE